MTSTHVTYRAGPLYERLAARSDKPGAAAKQIVGRYTDAVDRAVANLRFTGDELADIYQAVVSLHTDEPDLLSIRIRTAYGRDACASEISRLSHFSRLALIDACERVMRLGGPSEENWRIVNMTQREEQ